MHVYYSHPGNKNKDKLLAITGGDGHLDVIKVHDHDDNLSTERWSNFCFPDSLKSREIFKITIIMFEPLNS